MKLLEILETRAQPSEESERWLRNQSGPSAPAGRRQWKRRSGASSCFLIPEFPERLAGAAPVTDGAILMTVTHYVNTHTHTESQSLKIRAGFSGQLLFALEQDSRTIRQTSHVRDAACSS